MNFNDLKIFEIYEYYDGPLYYSATYEDKLFFVCFWNVSNDHKEYKELVIEITPSKLAQLKANQITLTNFIKESCFNNLVQLVTYSNKRQNQTAKRVIWEQIENHCPQFDCYLDSDGSEWDDYC